MPTILLIILCAAAIAAAIVANRIIDRQGRELEDLHEENRELACEHCRLRGFLYSEAPFEVKLREINAYDVIRTDGHFTFIAKRFAYNARDPLDRSYARRCAEELRDMLNENF